MRLLTLLALLDVMLLRYVILHIFAPAPKLNEFNKFSIIFNLRKYLDLRLKMAEFEILSELLQRLIEVINSIINRYVIIVVNAGFYAL